ncbi:MAG: prepilin-type N-terminal cleavage/methylation domain-containing protein [Phycisphaerae bacterium]|nr:prepilin-type N-terminal cleavage/methylation domain-containing protein [Phycisphaerae bacterium]
MGARAVGCPQRQSGGGQPEACRPRGQCSSIIHPRGFTLIELLVVIAAIALLMALLMPALSRARRHAKAAVCLSHLKQWGMTFALYAEDNEGHLPPDSLNALWMLRGAFTSQAGPNEPPILQDVRTEGIACCPMATQPPDEPPGGFIFRKGQVVLAQGTSGAAFGSWEITSPGLPFRGSYGLNASLEKNIFSIRGMARIPVLLDSVTPIAAVYATDTPPPDPSRLWSPMGMFCLNRHDICVGGLFLDWSVQKIGLKELWTLKWSRNFNTAGRWTKAGGVKPEQWPPWMRNMKDY